MAESLTIAQLSRTTGQPEERLREWRSLGLIGSESSDSFALKDAERVRLIDLCLRRGITARAIADGDRETGLIERYVDLIFPQGVDPTVTMAEAAELTGLGVEMMRKVGAAAGFTDVEGGVREQDIEGMRIIKPLIDIGFPPDQLIAGIRVLTDSLGRVAEMEGRLFHFYVHERLRASGLSGRALMEAVDAAGQQATPLVEPMILYFHRLGSQRAFREDLVDHIAEEAGLLPPPDRPGELTRAVAFIDLASFTPLTAAMGDDAAAGVLERFSELVREAVHRWEGRVVKQIGDAFMAVFPEPRLAVAAALEIESRTAAEPQFPAVRTGIHSGTVLYREGDYVGSNVNIASRLATEANRHQILVTDEVRKEARDLPGIEFVRLGKRKLKGLAESVVLFEARSTATQPAVKSIDPVCGMELGAAEVAARLSLEGSDRAFCSDDCLRKFVVAPEQYA